MLDEELRRRESSMIETEHFDMDIAFSDATNRRLRVNTHTRVCVCDITHTHTLTHPLKKQL